MSAQTLPPYVSTNGLVGWWPFNGNANDESVNENDGEVHGATLTTDRYSQTNKAYSFNGETSYISVPGAAFNDGISISVWVKQTSFIPNAYSINPRIVSSEWCNGGFALANLVYDAPYKLLFTLSRGSDNESTESFQIENDVLTHVCVTYDETTIKFYRNGELVDDMLLTGEVIVSNDGILIGKSGCEPQAGMKDFFKGVLDDIGMWDRALTAAEISALYESLTITTQPSGSSVAGGQQATITVAAQVSGSASISYQWQRNDGSGFANITDGADYSGTTGATLTIKSAKLSKKGPYRCVVSTANTTTNSNSASLTVTCPCNQ
jgi:hypothetical protein